MLETYQMQVFLAVVETGSYTAAARRMHLSQPAVSRQIRLLQEQLDVRLFRRVGRKMLPTHAGERLVETARQMLDLSRRVEEQMALLRGEIVGSLQVGASGAPAWHVLGRLLPAFRDAYPGIAFRLSGLPREGAAQALRDGRLDIVLSEEDATGRAVESELLAEMETVLVAPPDEQWGRRKRFVLRKLPEVDLILPMQGTPPRRFLEEALSSREVDMAGFLPALEVGDPGAALPLVAAGLGLAMVPRTLFRAAKGSLLHSITLWPGFAWPLYLIHRSSPSSQVEETFLSFLDEQARALLGE